MAMNVRSDVRRTSRSEMPSTPRRYWAPMALIQGSALEELHVAGRGVEPGEEEERRDEFEAGEDVGRELDGPRPGAGQGQQDDHPGHREEGDERQDRYAQDVHDGGSSMSL